MIDYEKIKVVIELKRKDSELKIIPILQLNGNLEFQYELNSALYHDIDDLLCDLRGQPRYKVGQRVWVVEDNIPHSYVVRYIDKVEGVLWYGFDHRKCHKDIVFSSRHELVESQAKRWNNLKERLYND